MSRDPRFFDPHYRYRVDRVETLVAFDIEIVAVLRRFAICDADADC